MHAWVGCSPAATTDDSALTIVIIIIIIVIIIIISTTTNQFRNSSYGIPVVVRNVVRKITNSALLVRNIHVHREWVGCCCPWLTLLVAPTVFKRPPRAHLAALSATQLTPMYVAHCKEGVRWTQMQHHRQDAAVRAYKQQARFYHRHGRTVSVRTPVLDYIVRTRRREIACGPTTYVAANCATKTK